MTHISTTVKQGKAYHYFRPPPNLMQFFGKRLIRLSDDKEVAEMQADRLIAGMANDGRSEPSKEEIKAARKMLANANARTKRKSMTSGISLAEIIAMMRAQSFRCAVTNLSFNLEWRKTSNAKRNAYAPSLDRIDNSKGYTAGNCRIVLSAVNYAMNEWGLETYITISSAAAMFGMAKVKSNVNGTTSPNQAASLQTESEECC